MMDYVHDDDRILEERVWVLQESKTAADLEVTYAEYLNLDLSGPIEAARIHSRSCAEEITELKAIIERVSIGYSHWEREGFEAGIDAVGEVATWEAFSEVPGPGLVIGNDEAKIRTPIDAQFAYRQALASRLFQDFSVCCQFEPNEEADLGTQPGPWLYYLFGILRTRIVQPRGALFLVAQWRA